MFNKIKLTKRDTNEAGNKFKTNQVIKGSAETRVTKSGKQISILKFLELVAFYITN